jgi:hypothetical protein
MRLAKTSATKYLNVTSDCEDVCAFANMERLKIEHT